MYGTFPTDDLFMRRMVLYIWLHNYSLFERGKWVVVIPNLEHMGRI